MGCWGSLAGWGRSGWAAVAVAAAGWMRWMARTLWEAAAAVVAALGLVAGAVVAGLQPAG